MVTPKTVGTDKLSGSNAAGSSLRSSGTASPEAPRTSRKRKRDDERQSSIPVVSQKDLRLLYDSICSTLNLLLDLAGGSLATSQGFAVEHLKAALVAPPDHASHILGSAFTITNSVLLEQADDSKSSANRSLTSSVLIMISYWEHSSNAAKSSSDFAIQVCKTSALNQYAVTHTCLQRYFSKHCLLPTVQLLLNVEGLLFPTSRHSEVLQALEALVISHTISPVRLSYLNATQPSNSRVPNIPVGLVDDLLASLTTYNGLGAPAEDIADAAKKLYMIAIKCQSRRTPKQRRIEHSWLQRLFIHIAESIGFFDSSALASHRPVMPEIALSEMLQIAVENDVQLDSSLLERILKQIFEIFDTLVKTHWDIVRSCMAMDPNIFTFSARSNVVKGKTLSELSNKLLQSLSENLIKQGRILYVSDFPSDVREEARTLIDEIRNITNQFAAARDDVNLRSITLPLLHAFAKSREFHGFLRYWQTQLVAYQQSEPIWDVSLWEDRELQRAIRELVEPSLTVEQIAKILLTICEEIETIIDCKIIGIQETRVCISHLVVLECVTSGCATDSTVDRLSGTVSSLYDRILRLSSKKVDLSRTVKASLWRVMATINGRWPLREGLRESSLDASRTAFTTVINDPRQSEPFGEQLVAPTKSDETRMIYSEKFQAFRFILSFISMEVLNDRFSANGLVYGEVMPWITTILDRFTWSETGQFHIKPDICLNWDIGSEPATENGFTLASLALIVESPEFLQ